MNVLVIGGSGYIGQKLIVALKAQQMRVVSASRKPAVTTDELQLDSTDQTSLEKALASFDVVINCVAGDHHSIAEGAKALVSAASVQQKKPRIIHLSSMAVYGRFEGKAVESTPLDPSLGWYASAKCQAEALMSAYAATGGEVVVLRPGCVYDAQSYLWVGRTLSWLQQGRLGDIGKHGDGWSNLVHVNDVIGAIVASVTLALPASHKVIFNLAAPDSPRWNEYFKDLALMIGATPLKRVREKQLFLDTKVISLGLKLLEIFFKKVLKRKPPAIHPFPAPLLRFFSQQIKLESLPASQNLIKEWVPYQQGLAEIKRYHHHNIKQSY